jgi:hypothetical protein
MKHSESIAKIAAAFVLAQGNLGPIRKKSENPHFHSKYADLEEAVSVIVPVLQAQGIAVLQPPLGDGKLAGCETMLIHAESGEWFLSEPFLLAPAKNDPQGSTGAVTYARRTQLVAMVCGAALDDDGKKASEPAKAPQRAATATPKPVAAKPGGLRAIGEQTYMKPWEMMQPPQRARMFALVKKIGISDDDRYALCAQLGLPPTSKEFTKAHASKLIDYLENLDKPEPAPPNEDDGSDWDGAIGAGQ